MLNLNESHLSAHYIYLLITTFLEQAVECFQGITKTFQCALQTPEITIRFDSWVQSLLAQLLSRHLRTFDAVGDLLESYVSCKVWTTVLWLHIDTERRKAAVVRCAQLINWDILRCFQDLVTDLFRRFDRWILARTVKEMKARKAAMTHLRIDESDKSDLYHLVSSESAKCIKEDNRPA